MTPNPLNQAAELKLGIMADAVKLNLFGCTTRVQALMIFSIHQERRRRDQLSLRTFVSILTLAGTAVMTACAGFSTANQEVIDTGTGVSTHTVDLSWSASTTSDISGYNIYRAVYNGSCGSFSKINSEVITSTWYTDSEVTDGESYCYATTAVDTSNRESGYSNIVVDVQIPAS